MLSISNHPLVVSRKSLLGNLQRVYLDIRLVKYFSSEALGEPIFSGHGLLLEAYIQEIITRILLFLKPYAGKYHFAV